jgi:hypothetical protein
LRHPRADRYLARMPTRPPSPCPAPRAGRGLPIWLPWVLAPGFLLLPIGGCGAAASLRRPRSECLAAADSAGGRVATVATVVPSSRTVAWHSAAD